jgi:hypothetical protein
MQKLLPILLTLFLIPPAAAQEIITVEEQPIVTPFILQIALDITVDYSVRNLKVTYSTTDAFGQPDTASGLLCIPMEESLVFPTAVYSHGTVAERTAVPSTLSTQERFLPQALAANGFITCAPDYIGLGESDGIHPYVHAATEASAGRDMLIAVKKWLEQEGIRENGQVFLTGYSQGGHATAALHRDISTNPGDDGLEVTAASHLSGPYSISEIMLGTLFSDQEATLPGYIAYTYIGYNYVYQLYDDLSQAFVEPYLSSIRSFAAEEISLGGFNVMLDSMLIANEDNITAIFQDSVLQVLEERDESNPIVQALIDNDTYDWAPPEPTLIYYCTADEQVPFRNAILADSVKRANGSTTVVLETGGQLDHGGCLRPAYLRTIEFFESLANIYPTSLGEVNVRQPIQVYPNPVSAGTSVRLEGTDVAQRPFILYDNTGREILRGQTSAAGDILLPGSLPRGLSVVRVGLPGGTSAVKRLIIK